MDLDGDGDLDILLVHIIIPVCIGMRMMVLKVLQDKLFQRIIIFFLSIDLDEDGDLDLVSHINDGSDKIVWWENDGSESFRTKNYCR